MAHEDTHCLTTPFQINLRYSPYFYSYIRSEMIVPALLFTTEHTESTGENAKYYLSVLSVWSVVNNSSSVCKM